MTHPCHSLQVQKNTNRQDEKLRKIYGTKKSLNEYGKKCQNKETAKIKIDKMNIGSNKKWTKVNFVK